VTDTIKADIQTRSDIEILVNTFYEKVTGDATLGPVFTSKIPVNWNIHLRVMYQFWENAILFTGDYIGNPMLVHKNLHKKIGLDMEQFHHWVELFNQTVDELFEGKNAHLAKERAFNIAKTMELQIINKTKSDDIEVISQNKPL
jgi:hemoglobin